MSPHTEKELYLFCPLVFHSTLRYVFLQVRVGKYFLRQSRRGADWWRVCRGESRKTDLWAVSKRNEGKTFDFPVCFFLQIPWQWIIVSIGKTEWVLTGRLGAVTGRRKMEPNGMEMCHHCWVLPWSTFSYLLLCKMLGTHSRNSIYVLTVK